MRPIIVVIDGPTVVGRTTTIAHLQNVWSHRYAAPLLRVGLDTLDTLFGAQQERWRELVLPRSSPVAGVGAHYGPLGRELTAGMHRAAKAWIDSGFDVVMEHTFLDRHVVDDLLAVFANDPIVTIALTCDDDVLDARERGLARPVGRARAEQEAGRTITPRDLTLDTSEATTEELVHDIMDVVTRRRIGT